ncbi:BBE domain-containing protein [Chromohalobacter moromii]|uniref:BBE domain-containing protein n=1 Tax=Chromohalobacter moromii TaxID=2860329 RepID=UPI001FFDE059|nr:BBE domain-containing protein [Chromohalobacter moromii]
MRDIHRHDRRPDTPSTSRSNRVAFAYGTSYERLAKLKKKFDPANIFRVNQNIRPA